MNHTIISIHPNHVAEIRNGAKTVEIRTRRVALEPGSYLWVYSTLPIGGIELVAKVRGICILSPSRAWREFDHAMGLSRSQYWSYVNGHKQISVIRLTNVRPLRQPVLLEDIRKVHRKFCPPQFMKRLAEDEDLYRLLAGKKPSAFR